MKAPGVAPGGFATTADAYRSFLRHNQLDDALRDLLGALDRGERPLREVGSAIRRAIRRGTFPDEIAREICDAYGDLNVKGADDLMDACRRCYASLFTDRAIDYRNEHGFDHLKVALSVGVQKMVHADRAGAGVMFSLDTETGFPDIVVINAAWGLGETVVQGSVDPDEYRVWKPRLMSDFKTNEYASLIGGAEFEPREENPMLGFRGASRYYSDRYRDGFALECRAVRRAREELGLDNIVVMIPFVRTPEEADRVLETMAAHGLERGKDGLELYMMCEVPSNVFLAGHFARRFDGFSIGSNDLTQLILGVDRDSAELSALFDERNEAVKVAITELIERAHAAGCKVGICGQAPSDYPELARFLVDQGIDSISLNPDSVLDVLQHLSAGEG